MRKFLLLSFLIILSCYLFAASKHDVVKVACVGNSITYGAGVKDKYNDSYPGVLRSMLGDGYDVHNFGVSGRTLLNKGDNPYMKEKKFEEALAFCPDIVTIKLGTNDSKPRNWKYKADFKHDLLEMIDRFSSLESKPKIYLCLPVPAFSDNFTIDNNVIRDEIIPVIKEVAKEKGLDVINLYDTLMPYKQNFPDGIHPNEDGSYLIAREISRVIKGGFEKL